MTGHSGWPLVPGTLITGTLITGTLITGTLIPGKKGPGLQLSTLLLAGMLGLSACTPTVKVATDEPITINLNVNIKHEILVKVDRELDGLFSKDSGLF